MQPLYSFLLLSAIAAGQQAPHRSSPPGTFAELSRKADAARVKGRLDEAARLYQQALRVKPGWTEGWWSLGTILYDSDRYPECARAFTSFIALKSDVGPAYGLAAKDRKEAEAEALRLRAPEGANFIKLIRDGLFERPKIGFAL